MNAHIPLAERFEAKIQRVGTHWLWTGATINGYPVIQDKRVQIAAHRLSYELHVGPIPDGYDVIRTCQRRRCVAPRHLRLVNRAERLSQQLPNLA